MWPDYLFMKESVSWEKDTPIFKTWRIIGPYNRTTVHESVDFASSVYCKRVSCLGMHINSLRIFGICMKFWFILCPRHAECFYIYINFFFLHLLTFFGGIYYLFTFDNYIYISGIWNLKTLFHYFKEHFWSWLSTS